MQATTIKVSRHQVWGLVSKVYPEYTGRKFSVRFTDKVWLHDLHWSGGTRHEYAMVSTSGESTRANYNLIAPWDNKDEGKQIDIPKHIAIVEHIIFCGKDLGIVINLHPSNLPKWLPIGTSA